MSLGQEQSCHNHCGYRDYHTTLYFPIVRKNLLKLKVAQKNSVLSFLLKKFESRIAVAETGGGL